MSFARVRALVVVGVLVVFALVFVIVAIARDSQKDTVTAENCPAGFKLADLRLREEKDVKVNVYNGTHQPGLASTLSGNLKNRKFQVLKTGDDPLKKGIEGVAELRYGPKGVGSAQLLRAYFLNDPSLNPAFDLKRTDDVVDVVVGGGFQQLATPTEKNQALGELGRPTLPQNTCAMPDKDT